LFGSIAGSVSESFLQEDKAVEKAIKKAKKAIFEKLNLVFIFVIFKYKIINKRQWIRGRFWNKKFVKIDKIANSLQTVGKEN
jgi:hypothetical protein